MTATDLPSLWTFARDLLCRLETVLRVLASPEPWIRRAMRQLARLPQGSMGTGAPWPAWMRRRDALAVDELLAAQRHGARMFRLLELSD